jgi:hypothetical protein
MPTARQLHGRGMARKRSEIDMRFKMLCSILLEFEIESGL